MNAYRDELEFTLSLADDSRRILREHFGAGLTVEWKGDNTPVDPRGN
jgi:hypothetical protein